MSETFVRTYTVRGLPLPDEVLEKLNISKGDAILIELKEDYITCKKIKTEDLKKLK